MLLSRLLFGHFEKALAALALIGCIASSYGLAWEPPQLRDRGELDAAIARIEKALGEHEVSVPPLPEWAEFIRRQIQADRVPQARAFPAWSFHRRPNLVYEFRVRPPAPEAVHNPPIKVAAAAARGEITVTWEAAQDKAFVLLEKYQVLRRAGEGEYEVIAEVDSETFAFVDKSAGPRTDYRYKVRSLARLNDLDPRVRHLRVEPLTAEERARTSAATAPRRLPRERVVIPLSWSAPTEEDMLDRGFKYDLQGRVRYRVYVNIGEGQSSDWVWRSFGEIEGGLPDPARIGAERGRLYRPQGRRERVDFFTGGTLVECGELRRVIKGRARAGAYMVIAYEDGTRERVTSFDERPQ